MVTSIKGNATSTFGGNVDLGANNLSTTGTIPAPTTAQVLSATAGLTYGDVGTYAFMTTLGVGTLNPGDTVAGSSLRYCNAVVAANVNNSDAYTTTTGSGTWRCMGYTRPFYNCSASVFVRIS